MSALKNFIPGFRLIDGSALNLIVAAVNNITGNGTPQAGTFSTLSASGVVSISNGAVGTPALSFTSDTDTGIYRVGANSFGLVANGVASLVVTTDGVQTLNGAVGTPSIAFASDPDTGLYRTGANALGVACGGALVGTFTSTGLQGAVGATTPAAGAFTTLSSTGVTEHTNAVFALSSFAGGLTAHAGGGQGSALALTALVNVISTVGTAADSVALPAPSKVGQVIVVVNAAAANSMQVFGSGTDTINGVATGTGVAQAAGKTGIYFATTTGAGAAWWRVLSA